MYETTIPLVNTVDPGFGPDIERRIFFVDSAITDFELVYGQGAIAGVSLRAATPLDDAVIGARINHLIENEVVKQGLMRQKTIWSSPGRRPATEVFDQLLAAGEAFEMGPGQVALGARLMALTDFFDGLLRRLILNDFAGREYRYPTIIPTRVLERCGYFESFPQFLMFVTRLHSDTDTYSRFLDSWGRPGRLDAGVLADCDTVDHCLPPTMCFHTFSQHAGVQLGEGANHIVTAKGKSFRFESRYAATMERLWDFTIREIVFMGSREFVLGSRRAFMDATFALVEALGLEATCEVANDPFFCDNETAGKILSQRLLELKYELRLAIADGKSIAVGSFNFHDMFFSERFGIRRGAEELSRTGCIGFGLERLVYAFLCQYGTDSAGWPEAVRLGVEAELTGATATGVGPVPGPAATVNAANHPGREE